MDIFSDFINVIRKTLDILIRKVNIDSIIEKIISIIFISIIMYFSIKIGNKIIQKFVDKQVASKMSFSL